MDKKFYLLAKELGHALLTRNLVLATAESCTGGWIGHVVTMVPGSSTWFERGFIVYSDVSKQEMLGVKKITLDKYGAVSEPIAGEMAVGALAHSRAQIALAVTGLAGPDGGTEDKPVGTVCFAWCLKGEVPIAETWHFAGDRDMVRQQSVARALNGVVNLMRGRAA